MSALAAAWHRLQLRYTMFSNPKTGAPRQGSGAGLSPFPNGRLAREVGSKHLGDPKWFVGRMPAPLPFPLLLLSLLLSFSVSAQEGALPGTSPLTAEGDLSAQMVAGIDRFLMRETEHSIEERPRLWQRDFSSPAAYDKSVQPNRERFRKHIGATDPRLSITALEYVSSTETPARVAETERFSVYAVRWPLFEGVFGEGLLLQPKPAQALPKWRVIALPDADQTPEMLAGLAPGLGPEAQWARRLAENGCQVIIPTLINRQDTWSGNAKLNRFTNQPHREWIYRQAFEMGRHIIGYEVQKVLAAVDWFEADHTNSRGATRLPGPRRPVSSYDRPRTNRRPPTLSALHTR